MKTNVVIVMLCLLYSSVIGQNRDEHFFRTEILLGKADSDGKLIPTQRFSQNQNIELDLKENAYIIVRKENAQFPNQNLPLGAYIREIAFEIQFQGKIDESSTDKLVKLDCETTPSNYPFTCISILPAEIRDKINTRNLNELKITVRLTWRTEDEVDIKCKNIFPTDLKERRIDVFTIDVKHFGLNILVDVSPVANSTNAVIGDVVRGLFSNLTYASVDYALTTEKSAFSNVLLTAPIIRYEGRNWLNKNTEIQATIIKSIEGNTDILGYGCGIGLLGDTKIFKGGVYWYSGSKPNYYIGVSLIGLANWITKKDYLK